MSSNSLPTTYEAQLLTFPASLAVNPEDAPEFAELADVLDLGFYTLYKSTITVEEHAAIRAFASHHEENMRADRLAQGLPLSPVHERVIAKQAYSQALEQIAGIVIDPHAVRLLPASSPSS
jgi:hypothetical protein